MTLPADEPGPAARARPVSVRRRWIVLAVVLVLAVLFALDLRRPFAEQAVAGVLLDGIDFYQAHVSGWLPVPEGKCRFRPTCSVYAEVSIRKHGLVRGSGRAAWRILRCGPWTPRGTDDPP